MKTKANMIQTTLCTRLWVAAMLALALTFNGAAQAQPDSAKAALARASQNGDYLFLICYQEKDAAFEAMVQQAEVFKPANGKHTTVYKAQVTNPAEAEVMRQYGVSASSPLPLLLAVAPNGVITTGYPKIVDAQKLQAAVSVSDLMLEILKPLQQRKIALVSMQNSTTKFNEESSKAIQDFANDPQLKPYVAVVKADPATPNSKDFLKRCNVAGQVNDATVLFLIPPARLAKVFRGNITKADLMSGLARCSAGSGCCPSK